MVMEYRIVTTPVMTRLTVTMTAHRIVMTTVRMMEIK
jgi:hypothetical protein